MASRIRTQSLPNSCHHHDHDYHQLVIAYQGSAEFEINGRGGRVDPFHGCLVPGGDVHFYEGIGDNSHIILDIPLDILQSGTQQLFEAGRYFEVDAGLRFLLAFIYREADTWQYYPSAADGITTTLLSSLHQRMFHGYRFHQLPQGKLDLIAIDDYISKHIHEPLSTSRLAAYCNVSAGHFHELFRQLSGKTPGQYLFEVRMKHAKQLIMDTNIPLIEIAEMVGFSSQSALTHAFRRFYKATPGKLRRR
ncbi:AraC family transcriptional regulator [Photobacterium sp. SP02]|uniref:helix-turn-helix transcriptional regulator n=1 Tax=Photobacterium sp. SP02 TaxID=3032280 RepID=UPI0031456DEC